MSSAPAPQSSSSGEDAQLAMDQKKRKRMLSNRESARRCRMRKQQHLDDLVKEVAQLKEENSQILMQVTPITQRYLSLESENTVLRTQVMELAERLRSLNSILHLVEELSGTTMDIPEIPDPLLKPLQLPFPARPMVASANMFQFSQQLVSEQVPQQLVSEPVFQQLVSEPSYPNKSLKVGGDLDNYSYGGVTKSHVLSPSPRPLRSFFLLSHLYILWR